MLRYQYCALTMMMYLMLLFDVYGQEKKVNEKNMYFKEIEAMGMADSMNCIFNFTSVLWVPNQPEFVPLSMVSLDSLSWIIHKHPNKIIRIYTSDSNVKDKELLEERCAYLKDKLINLYGVVNQIVCDASLHSKSKTIVSIMFSSAR